MTPQAMLRRYPLYALLDDSQLEGWVASGREQDYSLGETIFQEGASGDWACLVLQGLVRILRRGSKGQNVSLGKARPRELLGDYALLPPHQNTATCRAADATRLLRLPLRPLSDALSRCIDVEASLKRWLRLHALLGYLRGQTFLGFMSAPSALRYLDVLQTESFRQGRTVQADGLAEDRWLFIERGAVLLQPPDGPPRELGPGDCFGERALAGWDGLPVATALADTHCQRLARADFEPPAVGSLESVRQTFKLRSGRSPIYSWVGQREEADCGVAAMAMIVRCLGCGTTPEQLRLAAKLDGQGMSLLALQQLAETARLTARAVRVDAEHLADVTLPAIAHQVDGHYVVVFKREPHGLLIGDPATGMVTITEEEFRRRWSGRLLLVSPSE